jgi:hypothetical protein
MTARAPAWPPKTVMENDHNILLKMLPRLAKMRVWQVGAMHLDAFVTELRQLGERRIKPRGSLSELVTEPRR